MKKLVKRIAIIAVCIFTFTVLCDLCSEAAFDTHETLNVKVLLPDPVRDGGADEGVLMG